MESADFVFVLFIIKYDSTNSATDLEIRDIFIATFTINESVRLSDSP